VAVISRDDVPGDRQRFNLVHELGHLVMRVPPGSDEEALASRFAGAFLVPSSVLMRELGQNRTSLNLKELLILKRYFKVSIQSLVRRAFELNIISQPAYQAAFTYINRMGWRKSEPEPLAKEKSRWMERTVLRGVAEGMISSIEAHEFVGAAFPLDAQSGLMRRRKFLSLPIAQQDDQLRAQAEKLAKFYEKTEWSALDSEDFHEPK
jgi:Zn-dependent peptidase ImmA (M78 family)